jgi:hypothetical protein
VASLNRTSVCAQNKGKLLFLKVSVMFAWQACDVSA